MFSFLCGVTWKPVYWDFEKIFLVVSLILMLLVALTRTAAAQVKTVVCVVFTLFLVNLASDLKNYFCERKPPIFEFDKVFGWSATK